MKMLWVSWWVLLLAGWLVYVGLFALAPALPLETAPPVLTKLLFDLGRAVALILMGAGSYALLRQSMGVAAAVVLGIVAALAQCYALNWAIVLLTFPRI